MKPEQIIKQAADAANDSTDYLTKIVESYIRRPNSEFKMYTIYADAPNVLINIAADISEMARKVRAARGENDPTYKHLSTIQQNIIYMLKFMDDMEKMFVENRNYALQNQLQQQEIHRLHNELAIYNAIEHAINAGDIEEKINIVRQKLRVTMP